MQTSGEICPRFLKAGTKNMIFGIIDETALSIKFIVSRNDIKRLARSLSSGCVPSSVIMIRKRSRWRELAKCFSITIPLYQLNFASRIHDDVGCYSRGFYFASYHLSSVPFAGGCSVFWCLPGSFHKQFPWLPLQKSVD